MCGSNLETKQMTDLGKRNMDYAFYCCDGVFNMDMKEAAECAALVGAKHNIPYHNSTENDGYNFDKEAAYQFPVDNLLVIEPGQEILID